MRKVLILLMSLLIGSQVGGVLGQELVKEPSICKQLIPIPSFYEEGKLLLSNSPENVKSEGILYQDRVCGKGRILLHHINKCGKWSSSKRFVLIVTNPSEEMRFLVMRHLEIKGPSKHILHAGQQLLKDYFSKYITESVCLAPYESKILYDTEKMPWLNGELLTGMVDFVAGGELVFTTAMTHEDEGIATILAKSYLDNDEHPRGSYEVLDKYYHLHFPSWGTYQMVIEQKDGWEKGIDGITKTKTTNIGNYGIMYHITIQAEGDTDVFLVPRAGIFRGIVLWEEDRVLQLVERAHHFKWIKEPVYIGTIKAHTSKTLSYMLPNGSAAPIWLEFCVD